MDPASNPTPNPPVAPPAPNPAEVTAPGPQPGMPASPSPITYEPPANARGIDEMDYSNIIRVIGIIVVTVIVLWLAYALMITVRPK